MKASAHVVQKKKKKEEEVKDQGVTGGKFLAQLARHLAISHLVVKLICTNVTLTHVSHSDSAVIKIEQRGRGGGGLEIHFQGKLND